MCQLLYPLVHGRYSIKRKVINNFSQARHVQDFSFTIITVGHRMRVSAPSRALLQNPPRSANVSKESQERLHPLGERPCREGARGAKGPYGEGLFVTILIHQNVNSWGSAKSLDLTYWQGILMDLQIVCAFGINITSNAVFFISQHLVAPKIIS